MRGTNRLVAVLQSVMMMWGLAAGCQAPEGQEEWEAGSTQAPLVQNTASLATARHGHTVTLLPNGTVLAVGGRDEASNSLASSELYDPATNTWSATGALNAARSAHQAVLLKDGTVLALGGVSTSGAPNAERYNPATGTWSILPSMGEERWRFTATLLTDGRVLITGGCPSPSKVTAQIFDPINNTWSATGSMKQGRCDHRATLLKDGRVLITGGIHQSTGQANSVEIYDPASGTFTEVQPAPQDHEPRTALLLEDGRVMVLGYSTNHLYDPVTNTWTQAAVPIDRRYDNVLLRLNDGSVLLAGGDPSTLERWTGDAWSIVGHLSFERETPGTALLPDGSVLFVGGSYTKWVQSGPGSWSGTPTPLATTERFRLDFAQLATFDPDLRVPRCAAPQAECDSHSLLHGRGTAGAEQNQPNTLRGTCADGTSWGYAADEYVRALRVHSLQGGIMTSGQQVRIQATVYSPIAGAQTDVLDIFHAADANAPSWQLVASLPVPLSRSGMHDLSTTLTLPAGSLQALRGSFRRGGTAQPCTTGSYDDHDDLAFAVAPNTLPVVSFTSPASGSLNGSIVSVSATATDNVGVTRVEYFHGSTLVLTSTTPPYSFTWSAPEGPITLTARAYDGDGNTGTASVSFTVDRTAPTVALTAPSQGATVSGTVQVTATASDNSGIARVEFYANGVSIGTRTSAPYSVSWNTTGLTGTQSLTARAVDSVGHSTTTPARTVTVTAPPPGPSYDASLKTVSCASVGPSCDSLSFFTGRAGLGPESNAPNTLGATCADGTSGTFHVDESLDRLVISSTDGGSLRAGGRVTVQATVWAYSSYTSDTLDLYYAADARNPTWVLFATLTPTASGAVTLTAAYTLPTGSLQAIRGQFRYGSGSGPCTLGSYNDRDDLAFAVAP